ncbi:hypothetical protein TrVFT333_000308 [Trichoderma virens FT-333]|nr:hypothetical protein TrVFT333_000308 [Trichoderma virens FT-333]
MADTSLVDGSYVLHRPFYVPTKDGAVWAITFTTYGGTILTAGISVILTLIFVGLWDLICFIAIVSSRATTRRRHVALVTLWNSNDSWFAFKELAKYTLQFFGSTPDFVYGLIFCTLAFVIYGGGLSLGIVGPSLLQVGTVAPARPSAVYWPFSTNDTVNILQDGPIPVVNAGINSNETIYRYNYTYSLTGVDLGLQHGSDLSLTATGSCITEYGWIVNATHPQYDRDAYHPWNYTIWNETVPITNDTIQDAPKAVFLIHPEANTQYSETGNISFAILPWTAHRTSIKQSNDPWYATETRRAPFDPPIETAIFWIKRARPALSCWQKDVWRYGSTTVTNVSGLKDITGIKVKPSLLDVLGLAVSYPVLYSLGSTVATSSLKSATVNINGVINAETSSILDDLKRLVFASFVYTRNVYLDTTRYESSTTLGNALDTNGEPADGLGDFVLSSPNFQSFSMVGMIVLLVLLITLFTTNLLLQRILHLNDKAKSKAMLFDALPAAQLFRRIYEPNGESQVETKWSCNANLPSKEDKTEFVLERCSKENCHGHIKNDLAPIVEVESAAGENGNPAPPTKKEELNVETDLITPL